MLNCLAHSQTWRANSQLLPAKVTRNRSLCEGQDSASQSLAGGILWLLSAGLSMDMSYVLRNILRWPSSPRTAWPFQGGYPLEVSDIFAVFIVFFIKWWANSIVTGLSQNWKAAGSAWTLTLQVRKRRLRQAVIHLGCKPGIQVPQAPGNAASSGRQPFLPSESSEKIPVSPILGSTRARTSRSGCAFKPRWPRHSPFYFNKESVLFIFSSGESDEQKGIKMMVL